MKPPLAQCVELLLQNVVGAELSTPNVVNTAQLPQRMDVWTELEARIQQNLANAPNVVLLDVGGTIFKTTKSTLLQVEGSYFHALLGSGLWQPDSSHEKAYYLDLDPDIFRHVLIFLRTGKMFPSGPIKHRLDEVKAMTEYLNLNVWHNWNVWNPNAVPTSVSVYNDCRSIECTSGVAVVFALNALDSVQIRIDNLSNSTIVFGAGPKTGAFAWDFLCFRSFEKAEVEIADQWIVTMRRGPAHVDIALSDDPPFTTEVCDLSQELFCHGALWLRRQTHDSGELKSVKERPTE